ncbi:UDP-2,3-diacylglucosamine diphosphatase [Cytophagaceae bacterium YF14B1]|uniref:UDP-2,3-diacylglucosamine diphosphatase n=1 Tax=Xanthocytophaga flava TaxID=3048013 RepID=A0AAE3U7B6_9BACT|nr:UDP-2,3-diacylglucosamine diphosphatase [Xanthocytophaga flavus]MDJ1481442.1 UDP-2,3-diacylglucosamine diphosphatase [Xanthocytophaga flavus]
MSTTDSYPTQTLTLPEGKKIYFASDFHLGVPNAVSSRNREAKIVRWLESIQDSAHAIFMVGDIFDFWFEYKYVVPKGFLRLQGKLAELTDGGTPVFFFTGNHDMWMFNYFREELGIPVLREPTTFIVNNKKLLVGHGDGLGPGDYKYKFLKKIFANPLCQWLFARIHPNLGMGIANAWSQSSRAASTKKGEEKFMGDDEWIWSYCKEVEQQQHHDFYIFGHRHLPLDNLPVAENATYTNLGEWIHHCTYASFDGKKISLEVFTG